MQSDPRVYLVIPNESNEAFMAEIGSMSGTYCGLSPQSLDSQSQISYFGNSPWFIDSGATNHITTNLNNLSLHSPYTSTNKVAIGDG